MECFYLDDSFSGRALCLNAPLGGASLVHSVSATSRSAHEQAGRRRWSTDGARIVLPKGSATKERLPTVEGSDAGSTHGSSASGAQSSSGGAQQTARGLRDSFRSDNSTPGSESEAESSAWIPLETALSFASVGSSASGEGATSLADGGACEHLQGSAGDHQQGPLLRPSGVSWHAAGRASLDRRTLLEKQRLPSWTEAPMEAASDG